MSQKRIDASASCTEMEDIPYWRYFRVTSRLYGTISGFVDKDSTVIIVKQQCSYTSTARYDERNEVTA